MAQTMRCYYHNNCEDRPAVARCSKCGKGLCRECADNFRSEKNDKILCIDCRNEEIAKDAVWAEAKKNEIRKEMIFIIVGFFLGLAIEIFLGIMAATVGEGWLVLFVFALIFFLPTLLASFKTIFRQVFKIDFYGGLILTILKHALRFVFFALLCVTSPITFIWRLVKRGKDIKNLKRFKVLQIMRVQANEEYAEIASKMTTRLTTEEFERNMAQKYGEMLKTNKEEAEKLIAKEREENNKLKEKNAAGEARLKELSAKIDKCEREKEQIKAESEENARSAKINAKKAKKESRSMDDIDDIAA